MDSSRLAPDVGRPSAPVASGLAALLFHLAASTTANAAWTEAETVSLSSTSVDTAELRLVTNKVGDAALSWREGTSVVRAAWRPAGGPFAASQTLDANVGFAGALPRVGLGADGSAMVVWFSKATGRKLRFADRVAGENGFGAATDVFEPPQDLTSLDVVVDAAGAAHVAYNGPGFSFYPRVWARTRGPMLADFGAEANVMDFNLSPGAPGQIALATSAKGRSVLTYYTPSADVAPLSQAQNIEGAVRALGDAGWTLPAAGAHNWFCCLSLGPQGVSDLAMDASGRTYFVVHGVNDFADPPHPGPNFVLVGAMGSVTQGRQQLDPTWSNASGGTDGGAPQVAVDRAGNAWVAWAKQVAGVMTLFAAFRPAGDASTFQAARPVATGLPASFEGAFRLTAAEGGAVLAWQSACGAGGCDLKSAISGAASGAFWREETIATETALGQGLRIASLPKDRALVVYRRLGGDLEASRFSPPPLRSVTAPTRRKVQKAIAEGIPVTVDVGVGKSDVRVRLLDEKRVLDLPYRVAGRVRVDGVGQRSLPLVVQLKAAAAARIAARQRTRLTVEVTVTPPTGPADSHEQPLVLLQ